MGLRLPLPPPTRSEPRREGPPAHSHLLCLLQGDNSEGDPGCAGSPGLPGPPGLPGQRGEEVRRGRDPVCTTAPSSQGQLHCCPVSLGPPVAPCVLGVLQRPPRAQSADAPDCADRPALLAALGPRDTLPPRPRCCLCLRHARRRLTCWVFPSFKSIPQAPTERQRRASPRSVCYARLPPKYKHHEAQVSVFCLLLCPQHLNQRLAHSTAAL